MPLRYIYIKRKKRNIEGAESKGTADRESKIGEGRGRKGGRKGGKEGETGADRTKYYDSTIHEWHHHPRVSINPTASLVYVIHISIIYK